MTPVVTSEGLDFAPEVVAGVVLVAMLIGVIGVLARKTLMQIGDELADLWREYGPIALRGVLRRRPRMPATAWNCVRCISRNTASANHCYRCGWRREQLEAPVPDAEEPAGPSAGLAQRTRR